MEDIIARLEALADREYAVFQAKLIPNLPPDIFIGVRTPDLRRLAADLAKNDPATAAAFLAALPHATFEENQLHAFLISAIKDMDACLAAVDDFLPYVDNWATSDQLSPRVFARNHEALLPAIDRWLGEPGTYSRRFGVGMLMQHFLDEDFRPEFPARVAGIVSDEYYLNMMVAWYFATALAKRWEDVIGYVEERRLASWTHNKAIQKALESYRVPDDRKAYLRTLKVKAPAKVKG